MVLGVYIVSQMSMSVTAKLAVRTVVSQICSEM